MSILPSKGRKSFPRLSRLAGLSWGGLLSLGLWGVYSTCEDIFSNSVNVPICIQNGYLLRNNYSLCVQAGPLEPSRIAHWVYTEEGRHSDAKLEGLGEVVWLFPHFTDGETKAKQMMRPCHSELEPVLSSLMSSPELVKRTLAQTRYYLHYLITTEGNRF